MSKLESTTGTGHGLKGDALEQELQKAEAELGINTPLKKEAENIYVGPNQEQVSEIINKTEKIEKYIKTPEEIAEDEKLTQKSIDEIKEKIIKLSPMVDSEDVPVIGEKVEKYRVLEGQVRTQINNLIENSETKDDKEVFHKMIQNLDTFKQRIKEARESFAFETKKFPSIENMNNSSKWWSQDSFLSDTLKNGENGKTVSNTLVYLDKLSPEQQEKIMKAFDFNPDIKMEDRFEIYNRNEKSFFKSSVKSGKKHSFIVPSPALEYPGIFLKSKNYNGHGSPDQTSIVLGKKLIEELFKENI